MNELERKALDALREEGGALDILQLAERAGAIERMPEWDTADAEAFSLGPMWNAMLRLMVAEKVVPKGSGYTAEPDELWKAEACRPMYRAVYPELFQELSPARPQEYVVVFEETCEVKAYIRSDTPELALAAAERGEFTEVDTTGEGARDLDAARVEDAHGNVLLKRRE